MATQPAPSPFGATRRQRPLHQLLVIVIEFVGSINLLSFIDHNLKGVILDMSKCPKCGSKNIIEIILDGPISLDGSSNDHLGSNLYCDDCGYKLPPIRVVQDAAPATIIDLDSRRPKTSQKKAE